MSKNVISLPHFSRSIESLHQQQGQLLNWSGHAPLLADFIVFFFISSYNMCKWHPSCTSSQQVANTAEPQQGSHVSVSELNVSTIELSIDLACHLGPSGHCCMNEFISTITLRVAQQLCPVRVSEKCLTVHEPFSNSKVQNDFGVVSSFATTLIAGIRWDLYCQLIKAYIIHNDNDLLYHRAGAYGYSGYQWCDTTQQDSICGKSARCKHDRNAEHAFQAVHRL